MDENTMGQEGMEQTSDGFLDGWEDATEADQGTDQSAQEPTNEAEPSAEGESVTGAEGQEAGTQTRAEAEADPPSQGEQTQEAPPVWSVQHLGENRTMSAKDITPDLLQKGLDYDRVRGKYEEAKPVLDMFNRFATKAGMSTTDYLRHIRTEAMKTEGMTEAQARQTVELEDREAAVALREQAEAQARNAQAQQRARAQRDVREFAQAFPEEFARFKADPKSVPESVWADVNKGLPLAAAYGKYAVAQARESAKAAETAAQTAQKNAQNAGRSTGSMKSAGNDRKNLDPFLEGWGD